MTRYIQRHSLLTRVTHGVAAIACILLAVTGLFVFVPSLGGGIMGGDFTYAMRMLHRVLAIPFVLVPLFAILKSPKGFVHLMRDDVFGKWDKDDVAWAMKFPLYLFAPGKVHMPPQHHVKSAQRLADGALIFFCAFLVIAYLRSGSVGTVALAITALGFAGVLALKIAPWEDSLPAFLKLAYLPNPLTGVKLRLSIYGGAYHWGYWANEELALGKNVTVEKDPVK